MTTPTTGGRCRRTERPWAGRGLSIVELLAERCGVRAAPPGKVVWFEVAVP